jgi:hypothetical protein
LSTERCLDERAADHDAGMRYAKSDHAAHRRQLAEDRLSELSSEAFPFSVVADSYCISRLVDQFAPVVLETRRRASLVAAEQNGKAKGGVVGAMGRRHSRTG